MKPTQLLSPMYRRKIALAIVVALTVTPIAGCLETAPVDNAPISPVETDAPDNTIGIQEPQVPYVKPGTGLPDFNTDVTGTDEEIDCENAEDLCDSGAYNCDDIADYCDIGPDDGSDIPDDWDWDQ
jgi:hypothetical protein